MEMSVVIGRILFFLVPCLLWVIGCCVIRARGWDRTLAFIIGGDSRLSLSRLQAFVWTLVIFGSFFAAMAVHSKIIAHTPAEIADANSKLAKYMEAATKQEADLDKKQQDLLAAQEAVDKADKQQSEADAYAKSLSQDPNAAAAAKTEAQQKLALANATKAVAKTARDNAQLAVTAAERVLNATNNKIAEVRAKSFEWVVIPNSLLALAGIAIGSGIFSNLISVVSSENRSPEVKSIAPLTDAQFAAHVPALSPLRANHQALIISGKDLGKSGRVRLNTGWGVRETAQFSAELFWKDDGTEIVIEVPDAPYRNLIVDTPNGKVCHEISGTFPNFTLGCSKTYYELADLFRDDKDPSKYDLMKFQMFGWTTIAVFIYTYLFLRDLGPAIHSLPVVPDSIVLLTGLSQAGYLGSKTVSNMEAKKTGN